MNIPPELIEEIKKGNCAIFIGAGLSMYAGLPSWQQLVDKLSHELKIQGQNDFLQIAQYYENEYGRNQLVTIVRDLLNAHAQPTKAHQSIAKLPFKVIFTTNYDSLIENALDANKIMYSVISSDKGAAYWSEDKVQVLKLHGSIDDPSSLILTSDDYLDFYRRHPLIANILKLHITTKTILFMGYSLRDLDFRQILDEVQHEIGKHRRTFYCVIPTADRFMKEYWKRKGVMIIEADPETFLDELSQNIKKPETSIPSDLVDRFDKKYSEDEDLCFVLMPFREELDDIYREIIKPAVVNNGMKCIRADEIYNVGPIMDDVWEQIQKASIIVAELTGRNPNVFYELGIAHAIKKKAILLTQSIEDIPFDLRHQRCIVYSNTYKGAITLKEQLDLTFQNLRNKNK
jgi:hypothetical protein